MTREHTWIQCLYGPRMLTNKHEKCIPTTLSGLPNSWIGACTPSPHSQMSRLLDTHAPHPQAPPQILQKPKHAYYRQGNALRRCCAIETYGTVLLAERRGRSPARCWWAAWALPCGQLAHDTFKGLQIRLAPKQHFLGLLHSAAEPRAEGEPNPKLLSAAHSTTHNKATWEKLYVRIRSLRSALPAPCARRSLATACCSLNLRASYTRAHKTRMAWARFLKPRHPCVHSCAFVHDLQVCFACMQAYMRMHVCI